MTKLSSEALVVGVKRYSLNRALFLKDAVYLYIYILFLSVLDSNFSIYKSVTF